MSFRWLALGLVLTGCASELVLSARNDELPTFRQKLQAETRDPQSSELDMAALTKLAEAIASRELLRGNGERAEERVVEVAACSGALRNALERVAEGDHAAAAMATQVLLDAGVWDGDTEELVRRYSTDGRDAWRAVGLRAAVGDKDAPLRAKGFLDADLRVRRAAVRAAHEAKVQADLPALYEVARLDPDRVTREMALRAIGESGDSLMLARLRELWPRAEESEQRAIVATWAQSAAFAAGGRDQLAWVLATQSGLASIDAAVALLRGGAEREFAWAQGVLVRALKSGAAEEVRLAAAEAPESELVNQTLLELASSPDAERATWAALRLAFSEKHSKQGRQRLLEAKDTPVEQLEIARYALAVLGEPQALAWLESQLTTKDATRRLKAGVVRLERGDAEAPTKVAALLADSDARVRTQFACWILREERPGFDYFHSQVRP